LEKKKLWNGCQSLANRSLHLKKKRTNLEVMMKMIAKIAYCQVGTGNLSAKMTIKQEIPQFLPMMGRKVRVYYRGITKLCINCYQPGHIKKNCKNSTVGWIDYVQKFKEEQMEEWFI
jgi:hypothetical protein